MNAKRKICVVTSTRAEYGLLFPLLKALGDSVEFELQLVVTGTHLSKEFGNTVEHITRDGVRIAAQFEMDFTDNSNLGAVQGAAQALNGFAKALSQLKPDLVVIPGDRYEMLSAALAACILVVPVAHIFGGDETEGAIDNIIRHAITKLAHLHFVTNEASRQRVVQMGEAPDHVFNFGHLGLDHLQITPLIENRDEFFRQIDFKPQKKNFLITYHPETLANVAPREGFKNLLGALEQFKDVGLIFTFPNADPRSREIIEELVDYARARPHVKVYESLGYKCYLSALKHIDVVIGNSSSGVLEVPSFKKPTVTIGSRQDGRLLAKSVLHCEATAQDISSAIRAALVLDCRRVENPYGSGGVAQKIVAQLKSIPDYKVLLKKRFGYSAVK